MSRFGGQNIVDPIRRVLVRRPDEAFAVSDPATWNYSSRPNLEIAREEHDALVEILRSAGAEVEYHDRSLPERGDLFVATRHVARAQDQQDRLRILLRHHDPQRRDRGDSEVDELRPEANVLDYVLAETVARACGGTLTLDTSDPQETLVLVELRTPGG